MTDLLANKYLTKEQAELLFNCRIASAALFDDYFEQLQEVLRSNEPTEDAQREAVNKIREEHEAKTMPYSNAAYLISNLAKETAALDFFNNPDKLLKHLQETLAEFKKEDFNAIVNSLIGDKEKKTTEEEEEEEEEEIKLDFGECFYGIAERVTSDFIRYFDTFNIPAEQVLVPILDKLKEYLPEYKDAALTELENYCFYRGIKGDDPNLKLEELLIELGYEDIRTDEEKLDDRKGIENHIKANINELAQLLKPLTENLKELGKIDLEKWPEWQRLEKAEYRTKAKAGEVSSVPTYLALPTLKEYQYSLSFTENNEAYMQPIIRPDGLIFDNGSIHFDGQLEDISLAELKDTRGNAIESIDRPLLVLFYSIILGEFEKKLARKEQLQAIITIYAPDLSKALGHKRNLDTEEIKTIIGKTQSFHNVMGVMGDSVYPILNFEGYNKETNLISFSSPYINNIIEKAYKISIRTNKKGEKLLNYNGTYNTKAAYDFVAKSSLADKRNKPAAEIVMRIVPLIAVAGKTPHIKASSLVYDIPLVKAKYEKNSNKNRFLDRTFKAAWKYLREDTDLLATYKNIHLPDENNPADIPTPATLNKIVYEFTNDGKKRNRKKKS